MIAAKDSGQCCYSRLRSFVFMIVPCVGLMSLKLAEATMSITVKSGNTECISFRTPKDEKSKISGSFDMHDIFSLPDPLLLTLYNENKDSPVYTADALHDGRFHVEGSGKYILCIENGVKNPRDGQERNIGFSIRVKPAFEHHSDEANPVTEDIAHIEGLAETLIEDLYDLLDHQEYLKERERMHRDITESTFGNIWRWNLIEKGVLVVVSLAQILYFKSFFASRERLMNRNYY